MAWGISSIFILTMDFSRPNIPPCDSPEVIDQDDVDVQSMEEEEVENNLSWYIPTELSMQEHAHETQENNK